MKSSAACQGERWSGWRSKLEESRSSQSGEAGQAEHQTDSESPAAAQSVPNIGQRQDMQRGRATCPPHADVWFQNRQPSASNPNTHKHRQRAAELATRPPRAEALCLLRKRSRANGACALLLGRSDPPTSRSLCSTARLAWQRETVLGGLKPPVPGQIVCAYCKVCSVSRVLEFAHCLHDDLLPYPQTLSNPGKALLVPAYDSHVHRRHSSRRRARIASCPFLVEGRL